MKVGDLVAFKPHNSWPNEAMMSSGETALNEWVLEAMRSREAFLLVEEVDNHLGYGFWMWCQKSGIKKWCHPEVMKVVS
jgi:hypothetical protein